MKKLSPQFKSFIMLFTIAVIGTYITTNIALDSESKQKQDNNGYKEIYYSQDNNGQEEVASASEHFMAPVQPVDDSGWKTYSNPAYGLSFKYASGWKITQGKKEGDFDILEVDPGPKYFNIKIYISKSGYYAIDGLPAVPADINGNSSLNVSNLLYGFRHGDYYFTFDNGLSTKLVDDFNALVRSVQFQ